MSLDLAPSTQSAASLDRSLNDGSRSDSLADPLSAESTLGDSLDAGGDAVQMVPGLDPAMLDEAEAAAAAAGPASAGSDTSDAAPGSTPDVKFGGYK